MANAKKTIAPRNTKGMFNTYMQMIADIQNGEADETDMKKAEVTLRALDGGLKCLEFELKLAVATGNTIRRIEATAFDDTTGEAPVTPIRKIG